MITFLGFVVPHARNGRAPFKSKSRVDATGTELSRDHTGVVVNWAFPPFRQRIRVKKQQKRRGQMITPGMAGLGGFRHQRARLP